MTSAPGRIAIFTKATALGEWCVSTDPETFTISGVTYGFPYFLTITGHPDFERVTEKEIYDHIRAVSEHRTGLAKWDSSPEHVSDYVKDWNLRLDKKFQMQLVAEYLRMHPGGSSMREMVDYFEHKHGYFMDRMLMRDLLRELVMTGQIDRLPSMSMAPSEMKSLERMAKVWLNEADS
ncbi:hypothetical protein [Crateriforma spongiae]|uniref:hypothetical protein n=1 Tax=Crateriforma spongiae TaxID=2724528 RepID=UPI0039B0F2C3